MTAASAGRLAVPGASLYYEVRGRGPALLIVPTGNGDATPFGPLADLLADRFTVITYDRRGFSRSPIDGDVGAAQRIPADVEDAFGLLDHLSDPPAHVLGGSSGAIVVLAMLERDAARIRTAVSHEPPLASVLPDARGWLDTYDELYETYRTAGPETAMRAFREAMGMTVTTRPPKEVELPRPQLEVMLSRLRHNQLFWFEHELRTYPAYLPDIPALKAASDRLVLGGGDTSREDVPYRPNVVLSERIGIPITHFPGGHVGYVTHPYEFAAALAGVLA
jgi:pimeloyl-ACP methyl ester carboxylesterase